MHTMQSFKNNDSAGSDFQSQIVNCFHHPSMPQYLQFAAKSLLLNLEHVAVDHFDVSHTFCGSGGKYWIRIILES
jgi:hypothetical protein